MTTPTYTYHLYQYVNGLGQPVFKATRVGARSWWHLGKDWIMVDRSYGFDTWEEVAQWSDRELAVAAIKEDAENRRAKAARENHVHALCTLKLVIREDINA